jgi:PAS domain S-box-containing protein
VPAPHRLVAAQLAKATRPSGEVDHTLLCELMSTCYEEMERDRKRVDRGNKLMEEELTGMTSDLERMVDQFRVQNLDFHSALDNMAQGLCLLDAAGRLIVANRRLLDIYGLSAETGAPGQPMSEILGQSALLPSPQDYLRLISSHQPASLDQKLSNGRIVRIAHEPLERGGCVNTFDDITERERANLRLVLATEGGNIGLWEGQLNGGAAWFSDQYWTMLGYNPAEMGATFAVANEMLHLDDQPRLLAALRAIRRNECSEFGLELRLRCRDGSWRWIHSIGRAFDHGPDGRPLRIAGVHIDVTERKDTERRLASAERLESIGRLAAGVAHEINTPVQFVSDNVQFLRSSIEDMGVLIRAYRQVQRAALSGSEVIDVARLAEKAEVTADLDYIIENVPLAIHSAIDGLERIATIVRSMKEFAYPDQAQKSFADLNRAIQSTLVIAHNEYKYVAKIDTQFGDLPPVSCYPGEINQVILNLLVNAAHAIADVVKDTGDLGTISVRTRHDDTAVEISIADTGTGIPEAAREKIFDPFFTTKGVGKGTGQGLAIAHSVIVNKHGGTLHFDTECGRGTTFFIRLPIDTSSSAEVGKQVAA